MLHIERWGWGILRFGLVWFVGIPVGAFHICMEATATVLVLTVGGFPCQPLVLNSPPLFFPFLKGVVPIFKIVCNLYLLTSRLVILLGLTVRIWQEIRDLVFDS